jgi:hypothetical protein
MNKNTPWNIWIRRTAVAAVLTLGASMAQAQTTISNNLTVLGYLDATNNIYFGTSTNLGGSPPVYLQYSDSNRSTIFLSIQTNTASLWQEGLFTQKNKMLLDGTNNLTLYSTNGSNGIILNPTSGGVALAGTGAGVTFADGSVISTATNFFSFTNGFIPSNNILSGSIGEGSSANGIAAYAFGLNDTVNAYLSIALGCGISISGTDSAALGYNDTVPGGNAIALGSLNSASGQFSTALGYTNSASGYYATAIGESNSATGTNSIALGYNNIASGANSTALGFSTKSASYDVLVFGQYNVGLVSTNGTNSWVPTDPVMEIGNGVSGTPSNAVTIFKTGEVRTEGLIQSQAGVRIPQTGDLGMGTYTNGLSPATLLPGSGLKYPNGS